MSAVPHPPPSRFGDPRYYQIAVLTGLLTYGTFVLEFDVRPWQIPLTLAVALGQFMAADDSPWELLMTTGLIYALPPAAIYYAFKRYMVSGLTAGAVKA